jgi:hypothetical protein
MARVSDASQGGDHQSIPAQLAAMREWARTNARTASTAEARCEIPVMDLSPILGGGPRPVEMS